MILIPTHIIWCCGCFQESTSLDTMSCVRHTIKNTKDSHHIKQRKVHTNNTSTLFITTVEPEDGTAPIPPTHLKI